MLPIIAREGIDGQLFNPAAYVSAWFFLCWLADYWDSVVCCAATVREMPAVVTEKLFTCRPAGSLGSVKLRGGSVPLPSGDPRRSPPPLWLHVTPIWFPVMDTVPVWVMRFAPPMPKLAVIECGPAAVSVMLPMPWLWLDSALDSDPKGTIPSR